MAATLPIDSSPASGIGLSRASAAMPSKSSASSGCSMKGRFASRPLRESPRIGEAHARPRVGAQRHRLAEGAARDDR